MQKTKQHSPYTHDLLTLTQIAGLNLDEAQEMQFNEITTFNVRARYDDVKHRFYKKATKTYTKEYIKITGKLRIWIKKSYLKK